MDAATEDTIASLAAEVAAHTPDAASKTSHEDARAEYLDSCHDLCSAIDSLESALISFTGIEEGVKGQVFCKILILKVKIEL